MVYNWLQWLQVNYQWFISILAGIEISLFVFYLSQRPSVRDKLQHKEQIRNDLDKHLTDIERKGINRKMVMINSKYVGKRDKKNAEVYAEIKTTRSEGVEFFGFIDADDKGENIYIVYLLPYENIEYIDLRGDDFDWLPQIICKFKGIKGTPWTYVRHYKESKTFHERNDPPDWRYVRYE